MEEIDPYNVPKVMRYVPGLENKLIIRIVKEKPGSGIDLLANKRNSGFVEHVKLLPMDP